MAVGPSDHLRIRVAEPRDAREIADVHVESWKAAYRGLMPSAFLDGLNATDRGPAWRDRLAGPLEVMLVVEEAEHVVGWAMGGRSRDVDAPPSTAELFAINLDPAVWRRGAGRLLWESCRESFRLRGYTRASLWVLEGNVRARAFYEAQGFHRDPTLTVTREFGGAELVEVRYIVDL